tara:strand:+ start:1571 stop:3313 length:1743 start_codon:yes stop_codon:yes gene_type:complete
MAKTSLNPADLIRLDAGTWFATYGTIKDKRGTVVKAPKPNILQQRMFKYYRECQARSEPCKMVVLKPRQKGASTCSQALAYHHFMKYTSLNGSLMGDIAGTSDKVFEIFRRFAESDQFPWTPSGNIAQGGSKADGIELITKSVYGKETAGSKNAGRSGTIQVGNMTEVAFWSGSGATDPALAYLQSLYDESEVSLCIADSTPNGPSGWFYDTCTASMKEKNDWKFIFAAWFEFDDSVIPFKTPTAKKEFETSMDEDEHREMDKYGCGLEQMQWRRRTIMDKCGGDRDKFRQEYPSDPIECFLLSSRPKFNSDCLTSLDRGTRKPLIRGLVVAQDNGTATLLPDPRGSVEVWEHPKSGCEYLVSIDTCTGEDQQVTGITADPDYHSAQVWRNAYRDQHGVWHNTALVALHHSRLDIVYLAEEVANLSKLYGKCIAVPEVNNCGLALVKYLLEHNVHVWQRKRMSQVTKMVEKSYGWNTDRATRKTILDHFATLVLEQKVDIPSTKVIEEMKTFVTNARGKPEAAAGHHDDHVLAAAIALYNMDACAPMREKVRRINRRKMLKDPTYLCPDGWSRTPLGSLR